MCTKAPKKLYREAAIAYSHVLEAFLKAKLLWSTRTRIRSISGVSKHFHFALIGLFCILTSTILISVSSRVPVAVGSNGRVRVDGVGVYGDSDCSTAVINIDWGVLEPGSSQSTTFYVRNEGNHRATIFMETGNWNPPSASRYMNLSWNYDGRKLSPGETVKATLRLCVSSDVENITGFSFDVTIGATGNNPNLWSLVGS